jgi:hypothetical protein
MIVAVRVGAGRIKASQPHQPADAPRKGDQEGRAERERKTPFAPA